MSTYTRKNLLTAEVIQFTRVSEDFKQGEDDTPSCHCCGGPLHEADEIFSEECNKCFNEFLEVISNEPKAEEH